MKLICPKCHAKLKAYDKSCVCENHHSFDYSKYGYLNLSLNQKAAQHGDNKEMTLARTSFLNHGHYSFLKDFLNQLIEQKKANILVDLGCGEGYYTKSFQAIEKYGIDLSKESLKHASKNDKTTQYILSSIFKIPLSDECADTVITCFAPAANSEINRILKKDGYFIFVTPGAKHLWELKEILYETPYLNTIKELHTDLTFVDQIEISNQFHAEKEDIQNIFQMTPYCYKTGIQGNQKIKQLSALDITANFIIRIYQKVNLH